MHRDGARDLLTSSASVLALAPGFILPFAATWSLGVDQSDRLLLAMGVSTTLTNVIGNAIEVNSVAEFGRFEANHLYPSKCALRSYRVRIGTFALSVTLSLGTLLIVLYSLNVADRGDFWVLGASALLVPLVGSAASIRSGRLIAMGFAQDSVVLQGLRGAVPLLVVLAAPGLSLVAYVFGYALGEGLRFLLLGCVIQHRMGPRESSTEGLETRGILWQASSVGIAQGGPVTDRFFLARSSGAISTYEMADKLYFACSQFLNLSLLLRRFGRWASYSDLRVEDFRMRLRKDARYLLGAGIALALFGNAALWLIARTVPMPAEWERSIVWAQILLISLPAGIGIMAGGRVLVILRRQKWLFWLSSITLVGNAVLDAVFYYAIGPVGVPVATVIVRLLSVAAYFVCCSKLLDRQS